MEIPRGDPGVHPPCGGILSLDEGILQGGPPGGSTRGSHEGIPRADPQGIPPAHEGQKLNGEGKETV